jgi:hypothetical protein
MADSGSGADGVSFGVAGEGSCSNPAHRLTGDVFGELRSAVIRALAILLAFRFIELVGFELGVVLFVVSVS